jgi:general L-amino acid transport system permease protein
VSEDTASVIFPEQIAEGRPDMALSEARRGNGFGLVSANLIAAVLAIAVVGAVVVATYLGHIRLVVDTTRWLAPIIAALAIVAALLVRDRELRGFVLQVLVFALIAGGLAYLIHNTLINLESRKIATGYGFFNQEARFEIGESLVPYSAASSYGRALLVGFLNTLKVSVLGIAIATILGVAIGILSLSRNWLVVRLASIYVNFLRNVPILLHIILWYTTITFVLPPIREAISPFAGVYLTQRGLYLPVPVAAPGWDWALWSVPVAAVIAWLFGGWAKARQDRTGERLPTIWIGIGIVVGLPFLVWLVLGAPTEMSVPELKGFNFQGGYNISPEFMSVLGGLSIYTSAYIAEITRAGIMAVSHGQTEAGRSLGLSEATIMRKVILPQALRVIIPPTTNQYLNLTKNSSLSVAVGYPDLVSVGNTTLNQTGQAIEVIVVFMAVYLTTSLVTSLLMNLYNRRIQLVER